MVILLAVITAIAWGAADFFGGALRRGTPVFVVLAVSQLIGLGLLAPVLIARGVPPPGDPRLLFACVAGLGVTLELRLVYFAISQGDAFITAPVGALGATIAVVVGLIGGDPVDLTIAAGLVCAISGGLLCAGAARPRRRDGGSFLRDAAICAGAATGVAMALVSLHAAGRVDPYWAAALLDVSTALPASLAAVVARGRSLRRHLPAPRRLPGLTLIAVGGVGGDLAYAAASRQGALSVVSAISSLYPMSTIALVVAIQRQRASRRQTVGVTLALAGAAMLGAAAR